jgi:hypothetical protein
MNRPEGTLNRFDGEQAKFPPIDASFELVGVRDDLGALHVIDPSVPADVTVSHVLGEKSAPVSSDMEVDGGDVFSVGSDGTLNGYDDHGRPVTYNRETKRWEA